MSGGMYVIMVSANWLLSIISIGMLARAVLSWFTMGEPTKLGAFLYVLTEPIILPFRFLCNRFGWFRGLPFDMPFFLAGLALMIMTMALEAAMYL